MRLVDEYKNKLNEGKVNKNYYAPKVKSDHYCCHCKGLIPKGTTCLTINRKGSSRVWVCDTCLELKLDILFTECALNNVAFDDEGCSYALMNCLSELKDEFDESRVNYEE